MRWPQCAHSMLTVALKDIIVYCVHVCSCVWRTHCYPLCVAIVLSSSGSDRVDFKFYDLMEQILEKQPSTSSSTLVTESIEISEDSNGDSINDTGKRSLN